MKLSKSPNNKVIFGCLGGFAEYFGWDPTIVRVVYVLLSVFSAAFPGIIVYLILWLLMPQRNGI